MTSATARRADVASASAAFGVGLLSALQSRMNGGLAEAWTDPIAAATFSFATGLIALTVMVVIVPSVRSGALGIMRALRASTLRWWELAGGLCGGVFVVTQSAVVPVVGVAAFTVGVVAGQTANSLVVDRLGLGPQGTIHITRFRMLSAAMAVVAVAIAVAGRGGADLPSVLPLLAALGAGVLVAFQQAFNGRVTREGGNALSATWVNFLLGTTLLVVLLAASHGADMADPVTFEVEPWLLLGGVVGLAFIALAAWSVPRIGVLLTALLAVAGNLTSSFVLDVVLPTSGTVVNAALVVGIMMAFAAVFVGARGRSVR